jgi:hypothetical protein
VSKNCCLKLYTSYDFAYAKATDVFSEYCGKYSSIKDKRFKVCDRSTWFRVSSFLVGGAKAMCSVMSREWVVLTGGETIRCRIWEEVTFMGYRSNNCHWETYI